PWSLSVRSPICTLLADGIRSPSPQSDLVFTQRQSEGLLLESRHRFIQLKVSDDRSAPGIFISTGQHQKVGGFARPEHTRFAIQLLTCRAFARLSGRDLTARSRLPGARSAPALRWPIPFAPSPTLGAAQGSPTGPRP